MGISARQTNSQSVPAALQKSELGFELGTSAPQINSHSVPASLQKSELGFELGISAPQNNSKSVPVSLPIVEIFELGISASQSLSGGTSAHGPLLRPQRCLNHFEPPPPTCDPEALTRGPKLPPKYPTGLGPWSVGIPRLSHGVPGFLQSAPRGEGRGRWAPALVHTSHKDSRRTPGSHGVPGHSVGRASTILSLLPPPATPRR